MCDDVFGILYSNAHHVSGDAYQIVARDDEYFLREVITPIYEVLMKEAKRGNKGKASHSNWRNYDDLNEYFWSDKCFKLGWPMNQNADFFRRSDEIQTTNQGTSQASTGAGKKKPKTNFVEVRTFLHLYRSFDRMWIFFILALQAMIIIAWSSLGPIGVLSDADVFRNVMTIFITYAFLNFLQVTVDIILIWNALGNMKFTQLLRYFLKFVVAAVWVVVLPVSYSSSLQNPTGLIKFVTSWAGDWGSQSLYTYVVALYMLPNIVAAILFFLPPLRRTMERSNMRIITLLMWWAQPKLYVGRGMHENIFSLLKYTLFWIMLLISKLAFSYYVEILPLVGPTKLIMGMHIDNYQWHQFFPENETHNICVVIAIWAPIILVYFMDTQIWYSIYATLFGGIIGAFSHLGEIRTLGMLRSRFQSVPLAFSQRFWTGRNRKNIQEDSDDSYERYNIAYFSQVWNEFINSMREEDLISNRDRDLLLVPYSSIDVSVIQWPPFLLASKIPIAVDMAKDYKKDDDADLFKKIKSDGYMYSAVVECYETLKEITLDLLRDREDRLIIERICRKVEDCIEQEKFVKEFKMSGLPSLSEKLEKFLSLLRSEDGKLESQIVNVLQDIVEIIIQDVMVDGHAILQTAQHNNVERGQRFVNIDTSFTHKKSVMEKVIRLHLLLTVKESAINVPQNLEARRRITFFANSLFMNMPKAPKVRDMLSFSVLTPYYKENVLYSNDELNKENEDGITIIFYLTKIYPDEWANFHERIKSDGLEENKGELIRQWASYRGQTLYRTVRGMMYYWQALVLQYIMEYAGENAISEGYRTVDFYEKDNRLLEEAQALADLKFTYVVSCQLYSALRVAYIDETEDTKGGKKVYYSVLVKGGEKYDEVVSLKQWNLDSILTKRWKKDKPSRWTMECLTFSVTAVLFPLSKREDFFTGYPVVTEIYRIKLPGPPTEIGEGKPENQNHAIIFTRGEALQTIDMNQKPSNEKCIGRIPESVSSLAWFMSNQETSFVTIGQRILANPLRVRFHYGHPDIFDRIFHITRGGISKASKVINLSEDIFAGFNSTLRQGFITHHEYIQVGKGRDVGMNQISLFEAKVANGNGEQTLSRDVYRLGRRFDFFRMLSFYFTTVGFYFSSMITVMTVYVFLYGRLYMVLSGVEREILQSPNIHQSKALEQALATQSVVQLGILLVLPMVMEIGLEKGFRTALGDFVIMQLQLASVFFTFQLGTKAHYYGRTLLHGGSKYRPTGRGFVVFHAKFADNYRMYSRSHFVKGLEILILLIVYEVYGESYRSTNLAFFITMSMWFLAISWLFAPFLFNPSGFDWQKTVDDWTDWKRWMGNRGGIGIPSDKSWESWWDEENEHLKYSNIRGKILEIILALRFFIYQYGIIYHLNIFHRSKSILVEQLIFYVLQSY
ncbi:Glycosyl transferase, family 48 [Sesbania bispinosa]|nr:Glycosyl transferase, family 48 [Sesbania bispinosa]